MSCNEGLIEAGEQVGCILVTLLCGFAKTQQYLLQMDLLELEEARLDNACPHFLSGDVVVESGSAVRTSTINHTSSSSSSLLSRNSDCSAS